MRIAVDARQVFRPQRRGIGKTLINLYRTLAARRPEWRFVLIHQSSTPVPELEQLPNVSHTRLDFLGADRLELWERAFLPAATLASRADVLHCPANTGPRFAPTPVVLNVHDLIPVEMAPDDPRTAHWFRRVAASARRAAIVITGSEYSRERITDLLGVPKEKLVVLPWAPDLDARRIDDPAELDRVRVAHGLHPGEPYLFGFGADDPRKNTRLVIEAYARLPATLRGEFRLLLVGIQDEALPRFRELVASFGLGSRALLQSFTDEANLPALLSGATALCFPSRSEGFGLPVLDAFACGTPVLTGNRTSLPEVAGDAALLVDPDSVEAVCEGMSRLLRDEVLRRDLVARGEERVKSFTWDRTADAVATVFETVVRH